MIIVYYIDLYSMHRYSDVLPICHMSGVVNLMSLAFQEELEKKRAELLGSQWTDGPYMVPMMHAELHGLCILFT